jgi:hypothetical protein
MAAIIEAHKDPRFKDIVAEELLIELYIEYYKKHEVAPGYYPKELGDTFKKIVLGGDTFKKIVLGVEE